VIKGGGKSLRHVSGKLACSLGGNSVYGDHLQLGSPPLSADTGYRGCVVLTSWVLTTARYKMETFGNHKASNSKIRKHTIKNFELFGV
jgi:hypothetical protein